jgi:hypothetical protein
MLWRTHKAAAPNLQHYTASDELMTLAQSRPEDRDATLLRAATALFCQEPSHDRDGIRRFEQLAVHLLPKVSGEDRAYIATLLGGRDDAPPSVVRVLARDAIEIAGPVLRHSPVLSTIDLLGVIAVTGSDHHRLIAGRTDLSADVLRALAIARQKASTEKPSKINAKEPAASPESALPPAEAKPSGPTMPMPDFGAFLASPRKHRLWILSEAATRGVAAGGANPPRQLDQMLRKSYALAEIVTSAKRRDRLGILAGFSSALGLATEIVARLLDDPSGEPLVLMIKAAGLDTSDGNTVLLLGHKKIGESVEEFFRLADLLASIEKSTADAFIATWRQPPLRRRPVHVPVFVDTGERRHLPAFPDADAAAAPKRAQET